MTLQESKDKIAQKHSWTSFEEMTIHATFSELVTVMDKAAELYAQSVKAEAWDKLLEEVKDILDIPLEEQEKLSNLSNPYKS